MDKKTIQDQKANPEAAKARIFHLNPNVQKMHIELFSLELIRENGHLRPYWKIETTDDDGLMWKFLFEKSGHLTAVEKIGSEFYSAVEASIYPLGIKRSTLTDVSLPNLSFGQDMVSNLIKVMSDSDTHITVSGEPLRFAPADERFEEVQAYWFIQQALNWFATLGIKSSQTLEARLHVGFPKKTNTAFYYNGKIRLGSGDDRIYTRMALDPSVVTHETSHSIIDQLSHLATQDEGGSLNEGYADFFTAVALGNPKIGDVAYMKGPFRRQVDGLRKLSEKQGDLYGDSGIISNLLWQATQSLAPGMGLKLALATLEQLGPASDFADFRKQLLIQIPRILDPADQLKMFGLLTDRGWPVD